MHLGSYQIDGRAANLSASRLKRQDSNLIVIESIGAAAAFKWAYDERFAGAWLRREAIDVF